MFQDQNNRIDEFQNLNNNSESIIIDIIKKKSLINTFDFKANLKDDLKIDPMDFFDIILELEQIFSIEIQDEDIYNITTVSDLIIYIKKKI